MLGALDARILMSSRCVDEEEGALAAAVGTGRRLALVPDRTLLRSEMRTLGGETPDTSEAPLDASVPPDPPDPFFTPSSSLIDGRYRIRRRLGAGAMGVVYEVQDVLLERPAAMKVIDPALATTPAAEKNLLREARALARLRHSNIVQVYAFGSFASRFFFAMEYVDGESLEDIFVRSATSGERMPLPRVLDIVTAVASGLSEAHAHGIIHRDVKPSNIVIERATGRPVLIDFGIAREVGGATRSSFVVAGTPSYMAPEQVSHNRSLFGHKVDLYALACTAFELLTGRSVFDVEDSYGMLHAQITRQPPAVSSFRPEYAALDAVFARALAKEPWDRHESCDAFAAELVRAARDARLVEGCVEERTSPTMWKLRVLVLIAEERLRNMLVPRLREALTQPGTTLEIECTTEPNAFLAAYAREPAAVVVLDEDVAEEASLDVTREVLALAEGGGVESPHVLAVTRRFLEQRAQWQSLGARLLSKPLSMRALASTLDEIGADLQHVASSLPRP